MNIKLRNLQLLVTFIAIGIAIVHILMPTLAIDTVTIALFVIALFPWFSFLFHRIELPGGVKVELKDLEKVKSDADEAGLIAKKKIKRTYSFQEVNDPNLALAGLRIEIEKNLRSIATANGIAKRKHNAELIKTLLKPEALSFEEASVLLDLIGLLNQAVHGATVEVSAQTWAMDVGPKILEALEAKVKG